MALNKLTQLNKPNQDTASNAETNAPSIRVPRNEKIVLTIRSLANHIFTEEGSKENPLSLHFNA